LKNYFVNKLFFYTYFRFLRLNLVSLTKDSKIAGSVKLKKVLISGKVHIRENAILQAGVTILCSSGIDIGRFTIINGPNTDFYASIHPIELGSFCSIARNVSFQEFSHYTDRITTHLIFKHIFKKENKDIFSKGPIKIGNDVWVGAHSVILSGVTVGNGAVIASNSVVNNDVPPYAIVAGSPAKVIRYRFDEETISLLEKIKWWEWSVEKIKEHEDLFNSSLENNQEKLRRFL
jgi:virginiamycin A acetyltransferase